MRRRQRADEPLTISSRAELVIARPPEVVMAFLCEPESAVLAGEHVERCFRVPDTPVGAVGEQHVMVLRPGGPLHVEIEEVVELDLPHRVVTCNRTTAGDLTTTYTCEPRPGGATSYVQEVRITVRRADAVRLQRLFDAETVRSAARVKAALEGGGWAPAERPS